MTKWSNRALQWKTVHITTIRKVDLELKARVSKPSADEVVVSHLVKCPLPLFTLNSTGGPLQVPEDPHAPPPRAFNQRWIRVGQRRTTLANIYPALVFFFRYVLALHGYDQIIVRSCVEVLHRVTLSDYSIADLSWDFYSEVFLTCGCKYGLTCQCGWLVCCVWININPGIALCMQCKLTSLDNAMSGGVWWTWSENCTLFCTMMLCTYHTKNKEG